MKIGYDVSARIASLGMIVSGTLAALSMISWFAGHRLPATGSLAFVSDRDGNDEIYLLDIDRDFLYRVTDNPFGDRYPTWSPDGRYIAFQSDRDGNYEIYVMNANGNNVRRLTENSADDLQPSWSPDGARIVFISSRNGGGELFVMDTDGSSVRQLTDNFAWDGNPTWLPDGRIGFDSTRSRSSEIFVMDASGDHVEQLTDNPAGDVEAAWSRDGRFVFASNRGGSRELYLMDANCGDCEPRRMTENGFEEQFPAWLPTGTWIAFHGDQQGNMDVYLISDDGSTFRQVTDHPALDRFPAWWP